MQILLKADGMPTYHLANVVDDHLMEISHIIRGEEWISSAPKHILLYEYFGWKVPKFCHLPLLRNTDKSKLSKRKNPTSILYYREKGFLPEALLNYLSRMGWSMPDEREKFTLDEMLEVFDIQRISLGGPVFDVDKLGWLNGIWIREELSDNDLKIRLKDTLRHHSHLDQLLPLVKPRMRLLSDYEKITEFLFTETLDITEESFFSLNIEKELIVKILQFTIWSLDKIDDWTKDSIFETLKIVADLTNLKLKRFLAPIFVSIAGTTSSISVMDSICILGKISSVERINKSIELLGGVTEQKYNEFLLEFNQSDS